MRSLFITLALITSLTAQTKPADTGTLAGRVFRNDAPVARALITIDAGDGRAERVTATNDDGEFVFPELAAGRYLVRASKHGWVTSHYGSPRLGRPPGTRVAVEAGSRANVAIAMTPGAVIGGRMIDGDGNPAVHAFPILLESRFIGDRQVIARVNLPYDVGFFEQMTGDRGEFRLYGLPPGTYYLVATPRSRVGSARMTTADEVRWASQPPDPRATPPPRGPLVNVNAPVFFPGTHDASQAQPIVLGPGEVRDGLTYRLVNVPVARISGTVRTSDGTPPCAGVRLEHVDAKVLLEGGVGSAGGVDKTGAFTLNQVPPGEYRLIAQSVPCGGMGGSAEAAPQQPRQPNYPVYWGQTTVNVAGQDLDGVSITMSPAASLSGRLVFDGTTMKPPADLLTVRIQLLSPQALSAAAAEIYVPGPSYNATVSADGTFKIDGLAPDRYVVGASWPNMRGADGTSGWWLSSVRVGERNLGVEPIDVAADTKLNDVVVTFRDRIGAIEGQLTDAASKPATGYLVMAFPVERGAWTSAQRKVPPAAVGTDGHYRLVGLHAGDYYLAVVTSVSDSDTVDPAFLSLIVPSAVKVSVADGQTMRQDLKIAK